MENPDQPRVERLQHSSGDSGGTIHVTLTGKELGEYTNTKELRKAAMAYAEQHLIGKSFTNARSGHGIKVSARGIKHTIAGAAPSLIKTIPALPSIIEWSEIYKTEPDKRGDRNVIAVESYKAAVSLAGANHTVLMTVKCYSDGRRYYDHGFIARK